MDQDTIIEIKKSFINWIKNKERDAKEDWSTYDDEQAFGEMVAYGNVLKYLQSAGIVEEDDCERNRIFGMNIIDSDDSTFDDRE